MSRTFLKAVASVTLVASGVLGGCQGQTASPPVSARAEAGVRAVRIVFQDERGFALAGDSLHHAFIGLGAWEGDIPKATQKLSVGANDVVLPVGTTSLKATLVSQRGADEVYVARSTSELMVTPETEEVVVRFGAYKSQPMRNVMGILYEANGNPADSFQLSLIDGHSGAEIGLVDDEGDVRPDARGVYALRTFLGESQVRLRVRGKTLVRDLVLPIGSSVGSGYAGLPFVNLTGSDLRSPFLLNASLLKGDKGDKGDRGASGSGTGLAVESEPAGPNCSAGGSKISTWIQAAGTSSQVYNPAAGSSDLQVSYVCAPPAGSSTVPLYVSGTNIGNYVSFGSNTYLSADGVHIPIFPETEPGTFTTTPPTSMESQLNPQKPAVFYTSMDCTGTPYLLKNQSLGVVTPSGSLVRPVNLSASATRTPMALQSGFQNGSCKSSGIRYSGQALRVGNMLGVTSGGYDSTLRFFGPSVTLTNLLRPGTDVPFAVDSSLHMTPLGDGEYLARASKWGSGGGMNHLLFRSANGGTAWTSVTPTVEGGGSLSTSASTYLLEKAPSGVVVLVTNQGIYTSENGGTTWKPRSSAGESFDTATIDVATNTLFVYASSSNAIVSVDLAAGATTGTTSTGITGVTYPSALAAHNGVVTSYFWNSGLSAYALARYVVGGASTAPALPYSSFSMASCGGKVFAAEQATPGSVKVSTDLGTTWAEIPDVTAADGMSPDLKVACEGASYTLHYGKQLYSGDGGTTSTWMGLTHNFNASEVLSTREVQLPGGLSFPLGTLKTTP